MAIGRETPPGKVVDGVFHNAPGGDARDNGDHARVRQGREANVGFHIGKYLQTPPFFFTRDSNSVPLVDMYRGRSAFLIAGGPSFGTLDHSKLRQPGIITLGVNNGAKTFRPNIWTCVDDPTNFIRSVWLDPTMMKIVPFDHAEKNIFDSDKWVITNTKVGDCPNVFFYRRNERFKADQFLFEDTINWGDHSNLGGGRSVFLAAVRILFLLGIRDLYLLGVDFKMDKNTKYHFDQDRAKGSINGNNDTYIKLQKRFTELRPIFEQNGFNVYNCNPESGLTAFDHVPYDEAVARSMAANLPVDLKNERTAGLYDRKAKEKEGAIPPAPREGEPVKPIAVPPKAETVQKAGCNACDRKRLNRVIKQVDQSRSNLHTAKEELALLEQVEPHDDRRKDPDVWNATLDKARQKVTVARSVFQNFCKIRDDMKGVTK